MTGACVSLDWSHTQSPLWSHL